MSTSGVTKSLRRLWSAEGISVAALLVQGLVIARELGPSDYGVFALLTTFATFVFMATDPRSTDTVVRYLAEFREAEDLAKARAIVRGGYWLDVAWGLGSLLLVTVLAIPAARVLHVEEHTELIPVAALGLSVAAPAATSRAVLSVFGRFDLLGNTQFAVALARAVSVCAVALGGLGIVGVVWTLAAVSVMECALFVLAAVTVARGHLGGLRGGSISVLRSRYREIGGFVGYAGLTTLASAAVKQMDTLILGAIAGPREAGFYRLAKSLTSPAGNVGTPVQTVLYPRLAAAEAAGDPGEVDRVVRRTFLRGELPLALLALVSIPFVSPAIRLLAGEDFEGAVGPAIALVVGVAVSFATLHQRPLFLVRNLMRPLLWFTLVITVASLALFVPAGNLLGAEGVAWTRTGVLAVATYAMGVYLRSTRPKSLRRET